MDTPLPELTQPVGSMRFEALLRRDRLLTAAGIAIMCALGWLYLLCGAGMGASFADMARLALLPRAAAAVPMAGMDMTGMDMPGVAGVPVMRSLDVWLLTATMWFAMMIAMMAPAAAPAILIYARVYRYAVVHDQAQHLAPTGAFAAGYALVWLAFSGVAACLQLALTSTGFISAATMGLQSRWLSALVLAAAGLYQFSPLQRVCLDHCRSPAEFLSRHWRAGTSGAVLLGTRHGIFCLGCCWLLMALVFVSGVMNLVWVAALTIMVTAEKVLPGGRWLAHGAGFAMITWAVAILGWPWSGLTPG